MRDNEIAAHKKEIWNKTHKINDLQGEIQEYHREQLEKDGISLPPREETVLTLSGNFTQKDLDRASTKKKKVSQAIGTETGDRSLEPDLVATDNENDIFTIDQAVAHLAKRGVNVKPSTFRQKSTQLGFTVAVRGKGLYRLISN